MPNTFIFQLRNFDVTLMVFLMGSSFYLSSQKKNLPYREYLIKRFNRLIIPTWKFLILFFGVFFVIALIFHQHYYFGVRNILSSFLIINGIGYVWIMRVFFIIAVFNPLILLISNKVKNNTIYFLLLTVSYIIYAILLYIDRHIHFSGAAQKIFEYYIAEGFGYCLIAALGIRIYHLKKKQLLFFSTIFFVIFSILFVFHKFAPTQLYKYPPTLYYFSYGLFVSYILFYFLSFNLPLKIFSNKFVIYLSKKSLDLYYCHIIPIYIIILFGSKMAIISGSFITRFLFILFIGLFLLYLKEWPARLLNKHRKNFLK
ncbi:acyltransferase [Sporolactobacillus spathodeae]